MPLARDIGLLEDNTYNVVGLPEAVKVKLIAVKVDGEISKILVPTELLVRFYDTIPTLTYALCLEPPMKGGFGVVFRYACPEAPDEDIAVKSTHRETGEANFITEHKAAGRLDNDPDMQFLFIDTLTAEDQSSNLLLQYLDDDDNVQEFTITVMRRATCNLDQLILDRKTVVASSETAAVINFVENLEIVLETSSFVYRDLKLDQILFMGDIGQLITQDMLRMGDLGNLCSSDAENILIEQHDQICGYFWPVPEMNLDFKASLQWQKYIVFCQLLLRFRRINFDFKNFSWTVLTKTNFRDTHTHLLRVLNQSVPKRLIKEVHLLLEEIELTPFRFANAIELFKRFAEAPDYS
jgi:hypothetical protein